MATTSLRTPPRNHPQKPSQTSPSVGLPSTSSSPPSKMTPSIDDIKGKSSFPHDILSTIHILTPLIETARLAAAQIERTIAPDYPRRFRNINEAKEYIKDLCRDAGYDYMLGRYNLRTGSLHPIAEAVKDRAAFLVAIRAYSDQEFYLDEEVPDRQKLRGELLVFTLRYCFHLSCSCALLSFLSSFLSSLLSSLLSSSTFLTFFRGLSLLASLYLACQPNIHQMPLRQTSLAHSLPSRYGPPASRVRMLLQIGYSELAPSVASPSPASKVSRLASSMGMSVGIPCARRGKKERFSWMTCRRVGCELSRA